jgi:hypothetical protein
MSCRGLASKLCVAEKPAMQEDTRIRGHCKRSRKESFCLTNFVQCYMEQWCLCLSSSSVFIYGSTRVEKDTKFDFDTNVSEWERMGEQKEQEYLTSVSSSFDTKTRNRSTRESWMRSWKRTRRRMDKKAIALRQRRRRIQKKSSLSILSLVCFEEILFLVLLTKKDEEGNLSLNWTLHVLLSYSLFRFSLSFPFSIESQWDIHEEWEVSRGWNIFFSLSLSEEIGFRF